MKNIYVCVCVRARVCEIKVEDYVNFLYKGSIYTRYTYYVYVKVYVNLNVEVIIIF